MGWFYVREVACTSGESENEKFSSRSIFLSPSTSPPRSDNLLHSIEHCLTNSCSSICLRFFFSSSCPGKAAAVAPFCSFFRQPPARPPPTAQHGLRRLHYQRRLIPVHTGGPASNSAGPLHLYPGPEHADLRAGPPKGPGQSTEGSGRHAEGSG